MKVADTFIPAVDGPRCVLKQGVVMYSPAIVADLILMPFAEIGFRISVLLH